MDKEGLKTDGRTTRNFLRVLLLCLSFCFLHPPFSTAQQQEIATQNAVKVNAQKRLAEIERQTKALSGDIVRSERDLRVARSAIEAKRKVARDLDRETRRITSEMNAGQRTVKELESSLDEMRRDYSRMVYEAWKSRKTTGPTLFLLSAKDFNDASRRLYFIRRYNRAREEKGARIDSLAGSLRLEIESLAARKEEVAGLKKESDGLIASLAREQAGYETALRKLSGNRKKLETEAKKERQKIAAAQREIERIMARQTQEARKTPMSEAEVALSGQFGDNKGRLPWPTGAPGLILHRFGKERSADGIESDFKGLIIAATPASDVKAVFEGTVTWISDLGQYDKCVMVRSGEYVVGYGNIATPAVKSGDKVSLGQSLGQVTASDNRDRHLVLLWMQRGNEVLNPEQWLR
jgi:septal ring factor EnvC (AmiA/AmiB activator)